MFFTVCLARPGGDLLIREIDRLRAAVGLTRRERPFHVDAWVVLPDHMHAVWTLPEGDCDHAGRWGAIKARFSRELPTPPRRMSQMRRQDKGIWQRRFREHHIRGADEYERHVHYCWTDPVRHGLASLPSGWLYSSIHGDIAAGRVTPSWTRAVAAGDSGEPGAVQTLPTSGASPRRKPPSVPALQIAEPSATAPGA